MLVIVPAGSSGGIAAADIASPPHLRLDGKMVCVGASITAGEGVAPTECYVGLLRANAQAAGLGLEVIGQGRGGWSTRSYVENEKVVVEAMPADATLVTILLGTNDARDGGSPQEIGRRAAQNLGKLIDAYHAKAPCATFVVLSPTRAFPDKLTKRLRDAHYSEKTPAALGEIVKQFEALAGARGLLFINLSQVPSSAENSIDGIHVTAAGHQEIFEAVWRSLFAAAGPTTAPQNAAGRDSRRGHRERE